MSWHAVDGGVWTINLIIIALLQIKRVRDDAKMVNVRRWDERIDYGGCLSHEACCEGVGLVCSEGARKVPMSNRVFLKQGRWIFGVRSRVVVIESSQLVISSQRLTR